MKTSKPSTFSLRQIVAATIVLTVIILSAPLVPSGIDWETILRPATISFSLVSGN